MNFDNYKFHPSSLGAVMTDSRTKDPLGETCKAHLLECWVKETYGREKDIENRYTKKGLMVEEDSITLYSRVNKRPFFKFKEVIENSHLVGTPDLFIGESIYKATEIIDIKSSWDIYTFFAVLTKAVNKMYYWQLQGYMDLTGAPMGRLCYCLIDTPEIIINDDKKKLMWRMGATTELDPNYLDACAEIDKAMHFNDIPLEERFIEIEVVRDQEAIDAAHEKIELCRGWMNEFSLKQAKEALVK